MKRVLFVSNGHGEAAIAARIASELSAYGGIAADHLALVGDFAHAPVMRDVGPRRAMPSGGLVAMGNVRNIARDLRAGLLAHTVAQLRFLRGARGTYAAAIAVGDAFALLMAMQAAAPPIFVGTAKSVHVAPYGPLEERLIRRAQVVYVRDEQTASRLREHGIAARSGNAIVDLYPAEETLRAPGVSPYLALFPGSRNEAYADAAFLCNVVRELAGTYPALAATLSVAPGLDPARMMAHVERSGLRVEASADEQRPFVAYAGERPVIHAWRGPLGSMLQDADAVLGQAGTANEAAAASGIPVIAFAPGTHPQNAWYRRRQAGLLGDALAIIPGDAPAAARSVAQLLDDSARRDRMARTGRERMGAPGAAKRIAAEIAQALA